MSFTDIISAITGPAVLFAKSNPLIALAILLFLAFLIYRKPLFYLGILCLGFILVVIFYVIMQMSGSGVSQKEHLINRSTEETSAPEGSRTQ